jgi:hypothetical protein
MRAYTIETAWKTESPQFGVCLLGTFDLKARAGLRIKAILYCEREQLHDSKLRRYLPAPPELVAASSSDDNIEGFRGTFIPGR